MMVNSGHHTVIPQNCQFQPGFRANRSKDQYSIQNKTCAIDMNLASEYDLSIGAVIDRFWQDVDPEGHYRRYHANNYEARPSNQLAVEIPVLDMLSKLDRVVESPAQACIEEPNIFDQAQSAETALTLLTAVFKSSSSDTSRGKK